MLFRSLPSLEERYDRTIEAVYNNRSDLLSPLHGYTVGIFARNTRRFFAGDVVIVDWHNGGGERCKVSGWSHKLSCYLGPRDLQRAIPIAEQLGLQQKRLRHRQPTSGALSVAFARWRNTDTEKCRPKQFFNRTALRVVVEVPDELAWLWWSHSGLRPFAVSALRAAYPGSSVCTSTGGATQP